jgi:hypothetical protein
LRRLRQEASRGFGPELRRPDLAVALAADRFRVGVRNTAAVVRVHPAGSLLPTAFAAALMALFVLIPVSARIASLSQSGPAGGLVPGGAPVVASPPVLAHGKRASARASGEHPTSCGQTGDRTDDVASGEDPALRVAWTCWPLRRVAGQSRGLRPVRPDRRAVVYGAVIPAGSG